MATRAQSPQQDFWAGARETVPLLVGVVPFGLVFGALALEAGLTPLEAQGLSLFVFAGSSQFVAVDLIARGAAPFVIVLTIWMVNLRHALYSASLAPHFARLPARARAAAAWLLTDEAYAVTVTRLRAGGLAHPRRYFLGSGLALWATWQLSTAGGILFGARIPESWSLDFVLPLTFLALLIPSLSDRPSMTAAVAGGVFALVLRSLPYGLGLILATTIAVGVGVAVEALGQRREAAS
jgi:4-azaleucine resistance transporter AzlC